MDTIFAPITGIGGAIIAVRISGKDTRHAIKLLGCDNPVHRYANLVDIIDPETLQILDQAILVFFESPNSFTGEDVAEYAIHGSTYILSQLCKILRNINIRDARPGEFTRRALLNNKIDLLQAEGINLLIKSETEAQHMIGKLALDGTISSIYTKLRQDMISMLSFIETLIDFHEIDHDNNIYTKLYKQRDDIVSTMVAHLNRSALASKIFHGIKISIIGLPNVGKSSIMNAIANQDISIVSKIAGTTRDTVTINLNIAKHRVCITDTAGIHETSDEIEIEGIARAKRAIDNSDIKILAIDSNEYLASTTSNLLEYIGANDIIVLNKIDLLDHDKILHIADYIATISRARICKISALNNQDTVSVIETIAEILETLHHIDHDMVLLNDIQLSYLNKAKDNMMLINFDDGIEIAAEYMMDAIKAIGNITTEVQSDEILDSIFSKFCIGK